MLFFFFFFSSRRRHTRLVSDWSSDVCSSDLRRGLRLTNVIQAGIADYADDLQILPVPRIHHIEVLADGIAFREELFERRRSEEHTSELQSLTNLVCRLLLEKKKHNLYK